ncbi:hypothetical protein BX600DRAFT_232640 [Xylariales sp. PMI_506]|nr:hypothetical protein BX600DRAFT_232640 [Xylariales sp. PMI_506]
MCFNCAARAAMMIPLLSVVFSTLSPSPIPPRCTINLSPLADTRAPLDPTTAPSQPILPRTPHFVSTSPAALLNSYRPGDSHSCTYLSGCLVQFILLYKAASFTSALRVYVLCIF